MDNYFVRSDVTKDVTRTFIKQIKVQIAGAEPAGQVFQSFPFRDKLLVLRCQAFCFIFNRHVYEQARLPLNGAMAKVKQRPRDQDRESNICQPSLDCGGEHVLRLKRAVCRRALDRLSQITNHL